MKIKVLWVGISKCGDNRIWGHLSDVESSFWHKTTFWGKKGGKIYFQGTNRVNEFRKNEKRKREMYKEDPTLVNEILKEYEMHLTMKKLKGIL